MWAKAGREGRKNWGKKREMFGEVTHHVIARNVWIYVRYVVSLGLFQGKFPCPPSDFTIAGQKLELTKCRRMVAISRLPSRSRRARRTLRVSKPLWAHHPHFALLFSWSVLSLMWRCGVGWGDCLNRLIILCLSLVIMILFDANINWWCGWLQIDLKRLWIEMIFVHLNCQLP